MNKEKGYRICGLHGKYIGEKCPECQILLDEMEAENVKNRQFNLYTGIDNRKVPSRKGKRG